MEKTFEHFIEVKCKSCNKNIKAKLTKEFIIYNCRQKKDCNGFCLEVPRKYYENQYLKKRKIKK